MKKSNHTTGKCSLLIMLVFLLGLAVLVGGCGKKDAGDHDKETKTAAHNEKGRQNEPGVVTLAQDIQKSAGIAVRPITMMSAAVPVSATAAIELNLDRSAKVSPRVTGKVMKILVSQGDRVKAGQVLAWLDSVELDQIWSDYRKARGKVELAQKNLQREETLFEKKISPEKDVLKARQELGEAQADMYLARERFRLVGVDVDQFAATQGNGRHPMIPVPSPVGGVVIEKTVTQGEAVGPDKVIFMVADLSTLWVVIDVYEKDMSRLRVGAAVKASVTAFPDKTFKGRISYIADVVDEKTRTEKARVTIDNSGGLLKPGMFATVVTEARSGAAEKLMAVPDEAVQIEGAARYVFVQIAPDKFKRRDIETGRTLGKDVEVISGLKEGEAIAVSGAFTLKSELKKSEIEGDAH